MLPTPVQMLLVAFAGWINERQRAQIVFLKEQLRVLKAASGITSS